MIVLLTFSTAVQYKLDDPADPFASLAPESVSQFHTAVAVNGTTPLIAVQHAISAFRSLPPTTTSKALIFTGNILNHSQFKNRLCFGIAKTACAYGIRFASVAYAKERFRQAIYPYHLHFLDVHGKRQNGLQYRTQLTNLLIPRELQVLLRRRAHNFRHACNARHRRDCCWTRIPQARGD